MEDHFFIFFFKFDSFWHSRVRRLESVFGGIFLIPYFGVPSRLTDFQFLKGSSNRFFRSLADLFLCKNLQEIRMIWLK